MKKTIFMALALVVMGLFAVKVTTNTTANSLLDQNVEALAGDQFSTCFNGYKHNDNHSFLVCLECIMMDGKGTSIGGVCSGGGGIVNL